MFTAELVGASYFDEEDEDWACDESWRPSTPRFSFPPELQITPWEERLVVAKEVLEAALSSDAGWARRLNRAHAVAVGSVDGSLHIVSRNETGVSPR